MLEAVIFDMDGVLIDSEPLWKIAEIEGFKKVGIDLTQTDCEETVGLRMDEVVQLWYDRVGWENKSLKEVEEDVISIVIREIKNQGKVLDGVIQSLNQIKSAGLKIAIATSSSSSIMNTVVDQLNIREYFDFMHSAENETYGKPHPSVFISSAKALGVKPIHCLVIEDSLNGIIAAKAARMKVIAVPEKTHQISTKFDLADKILVNLNGFSLDECYDLFR